MDEVLFRSSQKLENIQMKLEIATSKAFDLIQIYREQSKSIILQVWHSAKVEELRHNAKELAAHLAEASREARTKIIVAIDPRKLYLNLMKIFGRGWTKRDICFACAGCIIGGIVGVSIGMAIRKREPILRYMQAVQVSHYMGPENATVVEDAIAPYECGDFDVLVNVKAASVHIVDAQICSGYGRTLRRILRRLYKESDSDLPVILGRDCAGIVTDLGSKVKRLEVGDEVWLTLPFWSQGTLCQTVLVSESRVSRKPKNIGFEGACSVPYAGSLALHALNEVEVDGTNARTKRILIQGGCTPVGCVLIQLLKHWKCDVTTTCHQRSLPVAKALGASEVIVVSEPQSVSNSTETSPNSDRIISSGLTKELELKGERFDAIIVTNDAGNVDDLRSFCGDDGRVVSTLPPPLSSDRYGVVLRFLLGSYIRLRYILENALGVPMPDYNETHLCYLTLDKLAEFVEDGYLQTVVDKVFHPHDIEAALCHIQSPQSIGSTIITFR